MAHGAQQRTEGNPVFKVIFSAQIVELVQEPSATQLK